MKKLIIRLGINAAALYAAVYFLNGHGLNYSADRWWDILLLAAVFGLVNAIIRPFLMVLSCPLILLTLGLGTLLVNTAMFVIAGWIGTQFGFGFTVDNFWVALGGALITSIVSTILSQLFKGDLKR